MSELAKSHLRPLERYLKMKRITDICIQKAGEVWVDREEGGWIRHTDPLIKTRDLLKLFDVIATMRGQKFSEDHPVLSTTLPGYGFRVEVQHPNILAGPDIGISIRTSKIEDYPLEAFFLQGKDDKRERPPRQQQQDFVLENTRQMLAKDEHVKAAMYLLEHEKSILIVGGTSTAKTTCLNSLLAHINPNFRIITIEDAQEVRVKQPNWLGIVKSKSGTDIGRSTYGAIVNSCLRCRPDTIVFGELDVENTLPFLRLTNTGHRGGLATLHANSAKDVLNAIMTNLKLAKYDLEQDTIQLLLKAGVYAIAHMEGWQGLDGKKKRMGTLELVQ